MCHKNTSWWRSALSRRPRVIGETEVFCVAPCWETGDRLVLAEEVLKHLTVQSLEFSGSFTVKRIGTVHSTIETERNGDSRRTCSNDEHVAGTTACFESRDLEVDS